jgi:predicted type IV restriction endonuclease
MKMTTPQEIFELVDRFQRNLKDYKSGKYNETQVRREFVDPLFKALGWDVENEQGYAEAYKDVIHEDEVRVEGKAKAPDYSFRIGGTRKFFVETKKPSVFVREDIAPAFQVRRYGWSAKLPLSIVTDFEEFAVYDCRIKPVKTDKASTARLMYLTFDQYIEKWDEVAAIFAREEVLKGSFDRFAEDSRGKRGTAAVDAEFLKEIEKWRDKLARDLALRNKDLSQGEINYAVQMTIDRIIFLRICEDRGIEPYQQLADLIKTRGVYERLCGLFQQADDRYNSGLFHFKEEKGRGYPDGWTLNLGIDDDTLVQIVRGLYYPTSPYEFSVMPASVLGQVYEQFLGKVIRLTAGHRATVKDKPEVKKAGGVYYTPDYIVEYIVRNTLGKLLEGKTPAEAAGLRILDPACGSGSFLIGAYQLLLDWHRDWYIQDGAERHTAEMVQVGAGSWRLTTAEKKRILLNNLYGVDIDAQAVEVTKLSLLLKVLEGETQETIGRQMKLFKERALPDLGENVKCGNSLIGSDFFTSPPTLSPAMLRNARAERGEQQGAVMDEETRARINAFDWGSEFKEVMGRGGFDAVIGNPPYIRIQALKEWAPLEVEFYKSAYVAASKGNYDIYVVFVERGLQLLNANGLLGFILPHKFFNAQYGEALRGVIAEGRHLAGVVHFGDQQVFSGATTYTCLLFLSKAGTDYLELVKIDDLEGWRLEGTAITASIPAETVSNTEWNFSVGQVAALFEKLIHMPVKLGNIANRMAQGIRTSANEVYVLDLISEDGDCITAYSKQLGHNVPLERGITSLFLQGREIKPYHVVPSGKVAIIPYTVLEGQAKLMPETYLRENYSNAYAYLVENKSYLENREHGKMRGRNWYGYVYPKNIDLMASHKILIPDIADKASFALDAEGQYAFTSGYGITLAENTKESPKYILGLLNSMVLDFYLKQISTTMRGGFFRYFTQFLEQLPIRTINFSDLADKARHDQMVGLVERMLDLHQRAAISKTPHEQESLERQIAATDGEIDGLVYQLYGLTDEEIAIVEGR